MRVILILAIINIFVCSGFVFGNTPDPTETIAFMPGVNNEEVVLFVLPAGTGSTFYEAQVRNEGTLIDAHIEIYVKDAFGAPIPDYPKEDLWLQSGDGGMVSCLGGTCADMDADQDGFSLWETPLHAGGHSEDLLIVYFNGQAIPGVPFSMSIVSADINGDRAVNLLDVGLFSEAFFGTYDFAADLFSDGVLNLPDVGRLAIGLGGSCP